MLGLYKLQMIDPPKMSHYYCLCLWRFVFPSQHFAAGKQTRQMLWEWGPHVFTEEPNFLAGGLIMNYSKNSWLSACQSS